MGQDKTMYATPEEVGQARASWDGAITLLLQSGMTDQPARRFFGGLLSKHKLNARDMLPAVEAGLASGTGDARSWLAKAAERAVSRQSDPALKCSWS